LPNAAFTYSSNGLLASYTASEETDLTYSWDFGDGSSDIGSGVSHNYNTSGSFEVTLIASDSCGNSDTITQTIDLFVSSATPNEAAAWRVFPNPSTRDIMLQAEFPTKFRIEVYSADGKRIREFKEEGQLIKLDFGPLTPGMYQIHCHSATDSRVFRIVRE
jgi:PKD repeat protein